MPVIFVPVIILITAVIMRTTSSASGMGYLESTNSRTQLSTNMNTSTIIEMDIAVETAGGPQLVEATVQALIVGEIATTADTIVSTPRTVAIGE